MHVNIIAFISIDSWKMFDLSTVLIYMNICNYDDDGYALLCYGKF